jgi:hypothetical protein
MTNAPGAASFEQLNELHLRVQDLNKET